MKSAFRLRALLSLYLVLVASMAAFAQSSVFNQPKMDPVPVTQIENVRQPRIGPSQTFEIVINEDYPGELMRFLAKRQDFGTISRAVIDTNYLDFEDETRWSGGQYMRQDPENPKRWVTIK